MDALDIDTNFEPQTRARSNTWPLPRPEYYVDKDDEKLQVPATIQEQGSVDEEANSSLTGDGVGLLPKKNSSRRNAWGNKSYADLITQAIQSAPEKRLTLSQIYDWMVHNVAYFKDKGDSNSSAGWKNSIRHNLSLHNRFMRVQNEGTGKSSWWMVNPDAKPGKAARRRATSMETQKYEKKRGRVKKKVESLRNGGIVDATPSPSSSVSEGLDMFPESPVHPSFQLSPDFRPRASSNASSCSRLSPIPSIEPDLPDPSTVPPLSPISWKSDLNSRATSGKHLASLYSRTSSNGNSSVLDVYGTDQLVNSMAVTMKLEESNFHSDCSMKDSAPQLINGTSYTLGSYTLGTSFGAFSRRLNGGDYTGNSVPNGGESPTLNSIQTPQPSPQGMMDSGNGSFMSSLSPQHSVSPNLESMVQANVNFGGQPYCTPPPVAATAVSVPLQHDSALRASLLGGSRVKDMSPTTSSSLGSTAQLMGHLISLNNPLPNDLDLNTLQGGLECDVDQVISHELSVDGNLDFNFEPTGSMSVVATTVVPHSHVTTMANSVVTRPWVH